MPDPNENEGLTREWSPLPGTRSVPTGDPFGIYTSKQPEPFITATGDPDDADR